MTESKRKAEIELEGPAKKRTKTERTYKCTRCNYTSTHESNYKRHLRTHSNARCFQCALCKRKFKTAAILKTHAAIHLDLTFPCATCGKVFKSKRGRDNHAETHSDTLHACTLCDKTFAIRMSLTDHIRKQH